MRPDTITEARKEPFYARVSNVISKLSDFKIVLRLTWGPIKGNKVTRFITNLKLKVQTFF